MPASPPSRGHHLPPGSAASARTAADHDRTHAAQARPDAAALPEPPDLANTLVCRLFTMSLALHGARQRLDDEHARAVIDAVVTDLDATIKDVRGLILTDPSGADGRDADP